MRSLLIFLILGLLSFLRSEAPPLEPVNLSQAQKPNHRVTRIFYLTGLGGQEEVQAIVQAVKALKTVTLATVNTTRGYVIVGFDQRDLSFHEIAEAIAETGTRFRKKYDPRVVMTIPDYAKPEVRPKVNAVLDDEKLRPLIWVEAVDTAKGVFFIHFKPLNHDPTLAGWQGFNGGAFTHPIHMAPPVGLALAFTYASQDDPSIPVSRN